VTQGGGISEREGVESTKTCPFCAGLIRAKAIRCRHCKRDLLAPGDGQPVASIAARDGAAGTVVAQGATPRLADDEAFEREDAEEFGAAMAGASPRQIRNAGIVSFVWGALLFASALIGDASPGGGQILWAFLALILAVVGVACFFNRKAVMLFVDGGTLVLVGLVNMASASFSGSWFVVGLVQVGWGARTCFRYLTVVRARRAAAP